jgi:hypothetical protein
MERVVVDTVTVAVAVLVPSRGTVAGLKAQVDACGMLLQARLTLCLKPYTGVSVSV